MNKISSAALTALVSTIMLSSMVVPAFAETATPPYSNENHDPNTPSNCDGSVFTWYVCATDSTSAGTQSVYAKSSTGSGTIYRAWTRFNEDPAIGNSPVHYSNGNSLTISSSAIVYGYIYRSGIQADSIIYYGLSMYYKPQLGSWSYKQTNYWYWRASDYGGAATINYDGTFSSGQYIGAPYGAGYYTITPNSKAEAVSSSSGVTGYSDFYNSPYYIKHRSLTVTD